MSAPRRHVSQSEADRVASGRRQLHLRVEAGVVEQLDALIAAAVPGFWDRSGLVSALVDSEFRRSQRRKKKSTGTPSISVAGVPRMVYLIFMTNEQLTADDLLNTEYTEEMVASFKKLLERCPSTTTALAAFAAAVDELEQESIARLLRSTCDGVAAIEVTEM
jgi:hypothetical protein